MGTKTERLLCQDCCLKTHNKISKNTENRELSLVLPKIQAGDYYQYQRKKLHKNSRENIYIFLCY